MHVLRYLNAARPPPWRKSTKVGHATGDRGKDTADTAERRDDRRGLLTLFIGLVLGCPNWAVKCERSSCRGRRAAHECAVGRINWPSDLMVRRSIYMEVAEPPACWSPFLIRRMLTSGAVTLPATALDKPISLLPGGGVS